MRTSRRGFMGFSIVTLLVLVTAVEARPQEANFVGTWQLTMTGGNQGGGGGNGGGGNGGGGNGGGRGGGEQSLTITQEGDKFKVSHKTQRGENSYDAAVSGNTLSWTEQRQGRNGNTREIQYKVTVDGDTMQGTMGGGQYTRNFTAHRAN